MSKEERILLYDYLEELNRFHAYLKKHRARIDKAYKNNELEKEEYSDLRIHFDGGIHALTVALGILDNCMDKHLGVNRGDLH